MKQITLLLITISFISCVKENNTKQNVETIVTLQVGIDANSRGGTLRDGDKLGIFVMDAGNPDIPYDENTDYINIQATYNNGTLNLSKEVILKMTNARVSVYYPYNPDLNETRVPLDIYKGTDNLFGGTTNINSNNPNAQIQLSSPFAMLRIWIKSEANDIMALKVIAENFKGAFSLNTEGVINLNNLTVYAINSSPHAVGYNKSLWITENYTHVDLFVLPCRIRAEEIRIGVNAEGRYYYYTVPPATWLAGSINQYHLNL